MSDADLVRSSSDSFTAQFVREGDGFLYRRSEKGPAIAVSLDERNAFVVAFDRWMDIAMLVVLVGGILAVFLAYVVFPAVDYPMIGITVGVGVILATVVIGLQLAWDAPARALAKRPHTAPALSRAESHRLVAARTTWSQVALTVVWAVYCVARFVFRGQTERWAIAWLVLGLAVLGVTAVRAYWKLRLR